MADRSVVMTWAARGGKLAEKAMGVPLGAAREIRERVFRATFAGVDGLERLNESSLKVAREALQRADKVSQDAIRAVEAAVASVSAAFPDSSEKPGEAVSKAAPSLVEAEELLKESAAASM